MTSYPVCSRRIGAIALQRRHFCASCLTSSPPHRQGVTLLGLLDLSAAFYCVDDIWLLRLEQSFGIRCTVLTWIRSFLYGRYTASMLRRSYFVVHHAAGLWRIPQRYVLGPLSFLLYTTAVSCSMSSLVLDLLVHTQAPSDDTQVYISAPVAAFASSINSIKTFVECVERVNACMDVQQSAKDERR